MIHCIGLANVLLQITQETASVLIHYHLTNNSICGFHHHHYQSLNREGRWGTTDDFATSFLHFISVLHCPLGLAELQACGFIQLKQKY